ncbi:MAG: DUF1440 domain-containing protein [Thermoanaerobaculia bacterium]
MEREPIKGIIAGAIGGLVASYVMDYTHQAWSKAEELISGDGDGRDRETENDTEMEREEENDPATMKIVKKVSEGIFDHPLSERQKKIAGPAVHYGFGMTMGALYGGLAEVAPITAAGLGIPFGAALWAAADEVAVPALGLSEKPTATPVQQHGEALASHLVYGVTTDLVRRAIRAVI